MLTHYFDIVSDIPSDILMNVCMYVCMHACSDILSGIYSDILSGIYSGKVSGIYADIPPFYSILSLYSGSLSGIYSGILSDIGTAGPQPPAPNLSGQCPLRARGWSSAVRTEIWACGWGWGGEEEKRRRGVIKSRDPHLAGGDNLRWGMVWINQEAWRYDPCHWPFKLSGNFLWWKAPCTLYEGNRGIHPIIGIDFS